MTQEHVKIVQILIEDFICELEMNNSACQMKYVFNFGSIEINNLSGESVKNWNSWNIFVLLSG